MPYNFVQVEWKTLREFPSYEMNALGVIRRKETKVIHSTQVGEYETVMLTKDGKRYHRAVRTLLKKTFPEFQS